MGVSVQIVQTETPLPACRANLGVAGQGGGASHPHGVPVMWVAPAGLCVFSLMVKAE